MARQPQVPPDPVVVRRLGDIAGALPQVREEDAWTGVRWRIGTHTIAHLLVIGDGASRAYVEARGEAGRASVLTVHSSGDELAALVHAGPPWFKPSWSPTIIGLVLPDDPGEVDWVEIEELVTESYRLKAPHRLVQRLEG